MTWLVAMMKLATTQRPGNTGSLLKHAAFGRHVDAAVRELRARGNDRLADALLRNAGDIVGRKRTPRELMAIARMARAPNTPAVITNGITEAISDVPELWDSVVKGAPPERAKALAEAARARIQGNLPPHVPSSTQTGSWRRAYQRPPSSSAASMATQGMSTRARVGFGLGAAIAALGLGAYAWHKGTEPKYKYEQEKAATATVQDYAARSHIDTTRQLRARMPTMRPTINTARFRPPATPRPTVAPAMSSASQGLGRAIKGVMGAK